MSSTHEPSVFNVNVAIPYQRVCDMLVGAFEGGYSPWLHKARYHNEELCHGDNWYAEAKYLEIGKASQVCAKMQTVFTLYFDDPDYEEGNGKGKREINLSKIDIGLSMMSRLSPRHFMDMVSENDDAITADVFLQYVIFGEVIYG